MFLKLAWRNIWRNKRRTIITIAAILFAVVLSVFALSVNEGAHDKMIETATRFYTGYAQVQHKNYWEEKTIDNSFVYADSIKQIVEQHPNVQNAIPRLESFALVSSGRLSKGSAVVGIDPDEEKQLTNFDQYIVEGEYISSGDQAVVIGAGLAKYLKLDITDSIQSNDTIILIGQGYHGVTAAGKYPVKGIFEFPNPQANQGMVFMPLKAAQNMYGAYDMVTSVIINLNEFEDLNRVLKHVRNDLDTAQYSVMNWEEMNPEIVQGIKADEASDVVVYIIIYTIIAFGIFGTILMMTMERKHEFGILLAIGMKRRKLSFMVWLESMILGLMGVLAGSLVSFPLVLYFNINPIRFGEDFNEAYEKFGMEPVIPTAVKPEIFMNQALIVLIIVTLLSIYPLIILARLKAVNAMRS